MELTGPGMFILPSDVPNAARFSVIVGGIFGGFILINAYLDDHKPALFSEKVFGGALVGTTGVFVGSVLGLATLVTSPVLIPVAIVTMAGRYITEDAVSPSASQYRAATRLENEYDNNF